MTKIKNQKYQKLKKEFKTARKKLGYNINDLNKYVGLSLVELKALEEGEFKYIKEQDYIEYYIYRYASLLGLNANNILEKFKKNYYIINTPKNKNIFYIKIYKNLKKTIINIKNKILKY